MSLSNGAQEFAQFTGHRRRRRCAQGRAVSCALYRGENGSPGTVSSSKGAPEFAQFAGHRQHEAVGSLAARVATVGVQLAYCTLLESGQRKYANEYYGELCVSKRRYVRASDATLPMSQTTEEGATGSVGQAPVGLAGTALLAWSQEAQHGAPRATERHAAEEAELLDTLL